MCLGVCCVNHATPARESFTEAQPPQPHSRAHARSVALEHSPKLYTSAALLTRPSISTSMGMWVTVPYVRVAMASSPAMVRERPKSDTWCAAVCRYV